MIVIILAIARTATTKKYIASYAPKHGCCLVERNPTITIEFVCQSIVAAFSRTISGVDFVVFNVTTFIVIVKSYEIKVICHISFFFKG